jgi:signal transduction histidine kinase
MTSIPTESPTTPVPVSRRSAWAYAEGLAPVAIVWLALVGWLAALLHNRANWSEQADEATIREWLDEARSFRKTLPELIREYVHIREEDPSGAADTERLREKRNEIKAQMDALTEPIQAYLNQLPSFPIVYRLEIEFPADPGGPPEPEQVVWDSTLPRPRQQNQTRVRELVYRPLGDGDPRAVIRCEYQLHAFNRLRQREDERRQMSLVAVGVLITATALAVLFVYRFLRRERERELQRLKALAEAEHREREILEIRLQQKEIEQARDELDRRLLHQQLEAANLERRANEAEKEALEVKSQLYASIGIMAGSYAHNIKNLLVRPNDLLARCLEADGMTRDQAGMLHEVRSTLGTVTERLQQILRTVRRDPSKTEVTLVDLNRLVRDTVGTWSGMAFDKWKLRIVAHIPSDPLWVRGDVSHLQQAVENLVFNARDATFEMRNHLVDSARNDHSIIPAARRQRLIEAYGWKGEVTLTTRREGSTAVLEVRDNGIGMTEEVRRNCVRTHFSTKRDNAIYEGYSAGMGLGLSFVAVVLEHHGAELEIESEPMKGAIFRIRFPLAEDAAASQPLAEAVTG